MKTKLGKYLATPLVFAWSGVVCAQAPESPVEPIQYIFDLDPHPDGYHFGSTIETHEGLAAIASQKAILIYEEDEQTGRWSFLQRIEVGPEAFRARRVSLAFNGNTLVYGDTTESRPVDRPGEQSGAVFVYERAESGRWELAQKIDSDTFNEPLGGPGNREVGDSVALDGDWLAMEAGDARVFVFHRDASGIWRYHQRIEKCDTVDCRNYNRSQETLELKGRSLYIGGTNKLLHYRLSSANQWELQDSVFVPESSGVNQFAWQISASSKFLAAAAFHPGDEYTQRLFMYALDPNDGTPKLETVLPQDPEKVLFRFHDIVVHDEYLAAFLGPRQLSVVEQVRVLAWDNGNWSTVQRVTELPGDAIDETTNGIAFGRKSLMWGRAMSEDGYGGVYVAERTHTDSSAELTAPVMGGFGTAVMGLGLFGPICLWRSRRRA